MALRKLPDLSHFSLGDIAREEAADANSAGMDMQHDLGGLLPIHVEEDLQHLNDKIHGGEVIVEQEHLVPGRRSQLRLGGLDRQVRISILILIHMRTTHVNAKSYVKVIFDLTHAMGSLYFALKVPASEIEAGYRIRI